MMNEVKKGRKLSVLERAAVVLLVRGCYAGGRADGGGGVGDGFAFAGRYEAQCYELEKLGHVERHPRGLMTYSSVAATLTSSGSAVGRQVYRLTEKGVAYAQGLHEYNVGHKSKAVTKGGGG